jgi:2-methylisocitrate lyase-like PEP mutase family enzyme
VITGLSAGKAAALLALHAGPGFVLPNAWDAGSARILEQVGFPAIATTSAGVAWSWGVPDGGALDRDTMLEHVAGIVAAVGVPVTADLEAGYGDTAGDVGRTVARAVELGAVGANLEDAVNGHLFGIDEAVDRIAAARAAAPSGTFVLNARTDTYFAGTRGDVFAETVERALHYVEAGANCVFVPGVAEADTIRRLAAAIPGPLNVVAGLANTIDAPTLFSLGVKRSFWGAAWPGRRSAWWSAPAENCTTSERSASSTARSATPACSDALACDQSQSCRALCAAASGLAAARPGRRRAVTLNAATYVFSDRLGRRRLG